VNLFRGSMGEYVVVQSGLRKGARVIGVLSAWAVYMDQNGGQCPTQDQLAGLTARSRASWSRDLLAFRECFEGEDSPERLARELLARVKLRRGADYEVTAAMVWAVPAFV
jgi:hypothetical protein